MYSRYGLYFRFTALQTVCKYDQLNPGKKKVLSFTLKEKSIQELFIGTNFHLLKFTVKTQPLILNFFYLQCPHGLLQKWWRNSLGLQCSCSRQMSTDPGCTGQISSSLPFHVKKRQVFWSSSLLHTGWEFLFPALRWNPCPLKLQLLFNVLLLTLLKERGIFVANGW